MATNSTNTDYRRSGNFWAGGVVTDEYSIIQDEDGNWYRYVGVRPKPFNVTPGVRPNNENWVSVGPLVSGGSNSIQGESFKAGGTVDNIREFVIDEATGLWYFWTGDYPKVIPANSTPETTGGVADGAWKLLNGTGSGGGDADLSTVLKINSNLTDLQDKTASLKTLGGKPKAHVDGLANFNALRSLVPDEEGQRVYIRCHTAPALTTFLPEGDGWFVARKGTMADDGGFIAQVNSTWYWERDKPIEELYIGDFGAPADGITDAQPAFQRYINFLFGDYARLRTNGTKSGSSVGGGYSPYLTLRYGAGTYYQTPGVYNKFGNKAYTATELALNPSGYTAAGGMRIEGAVTSFGRLICTKIISDKSDNPVFLINHRRFAVRNIIWDGQQTTQRNAYNKDTNPTGTNLVVGATSLDDQPNFLTNKQPFLTNECPGGCYMKLENLQFTNIGGHGIYVLDTLDSKVNEVFSSNTAAPWLKTGWSDPQAQYQGSWDHSTSIEITNINCSSPMGPALWLPRVGQGLMRNVWFEHGYVPFDINNGQWDMDMVCIEDCTKNATAWNCKFTVRTLSVPTGNGIDTDSPTSGKWNSYTTNPDGSAITAWSEGYGQGSYLLMNNGAYFDCVVQPKYTRGVLRGENNTDNTLWINVGSFSSPTNGSTFKIRIVGNPYYNTAGNQNMLTDRLAGETIIYVGRGTAATPKISFHNINGGVCTSAPQYKPQTFNTVIPEIWVPIRARTAEFSIFVESTGLTRREAGVPAQFTPSGVTTNTSPNLTAIPGRFSYNTNKAGFGANEDVVEITSRLTAGANGGTSTPATDAQLGSEPVHPNVVRWMRMAVGGQELAVPVYAWKPVFTTNNPATLSVAVGGTLTLSPVVTDAISQQWQYSSDNGTTWSNITTSGTAQTYTKANVQTTDSGQYRLAVRANNGSGGNGITTFGPVTTVTVA